MTKAQLERENESLKKHNENLKAKLEALETEHQKELEYAWESKKGYVSISDSDYRHYERLQETTLQSVERADKLQEANTELIKAIATLNGGVLKDLSQTIVNLSKKENRY